MMPEQNDWRYPLRDSAAWEAEQRGEQTEWRYPLWPSAREAANDPQSPAARRWAAAKRPSEDVVQDEAALGAAGWFDWENSLKAMSETGGDLPLGGTAKLRLTTPPGAAELVEKTIAAALEQLSQAAIERSARLMEQALLRPTASELRGGQTQINIAPAPEAQVNITPAPEAEANLRRWLDAATSMSAAYVSTADLPVETNPDGSFKFPTSSGSSPVSLGQDTLGLYRQEGSSAAPMTAANNVAKLTVDELLVYECAACGRHTTQALCIVLPKPLRDAGHAICHTCLERHIQPAIDLGRQVRAQSYSRIYVTGGEGWGVAAAEPSKAVKSSEDERPDDNAPGNYEDGL